uniref:Uncharacterized protein n=1 Tax=Anguilla anguilla TaxID=7936 RepID=A0A0E9XEI5_ANGAN
MVLAAFLLMRTSCCPYVSSLIVHGKLGDLKYLCLN